MTKDEIIKQLRDMAKHPTVTLPRDCEALRAAADLLAQPQRKPLTDGQMFNIAEQCGCMSADWIDFARAIEAAHGIK